MPRDYASKNLKTTYTRSVTHTEVNPGLVASLFLNIRTTHEYYFRDREKLELQHSFARHQTRQKHWKRSQKAPLNRAIFPRHLACAGFVGPVPLELSVLCAMIKGSFHTAHTRTVVQKLCPVSFLRFPIDDIFTFYFVVRMRSAWYLFYNNYGAVCHINYHFCIASHWMITPLS